MSPEATLVASQQGRPLLPPLPPWSTTVFGQLVRGTVNKTEENKQDFYGCDRLQRGDKPTRETHSHHILLPTEANFA